MARSRGRRLVVVLVVVVLLAGVGLAAAWGLQRQLVYYPDASDVPPAGEVLPGARDVTLHTADGLELGAWYLPADVKNDTGLAVLVAPGNGGNRAGRAGLARELGARGFAVLLLDYRGYGGNPGSPSEDGLAAVVLRSPFTDLADVGRHHFPWLPVRTLLRDRFPVLRPIAGSDVPVTVVYGDRDDVVPTDLSARVADSAPALVERVVLRGAGHNDAVMFGPRVADTLERLARSVG